MKTEDEYTEVVSGNVYDDIAVKHGSKTLVLPQRGAEIESR